MTGRFLLMFESPWQWMVVLAIVLLLFGSSRLPQLAKSLAQSKKAFKEGLEEDEKEEEARREKQLRASSPEPRASLSDVDDEALFEEARRRAAQRRAEESKQG